MFKTWKLMLRTRTSLMERKKNRKGRTEDAHGAHLLQELVPSRISYPYERETVLGPCIQRGLIQSLQKETMFGVLKVFVFFTILLPSFSCVRW